MPFFSLDDTSGNCIENRLLIWEPGSSFFFCVCVCVCARFLSCFWLLDKTWVLLVVVIHCQWRSRRKFNSSVFCLLLLLLIKIYHGSFLVFHGTRCYFHLLVPRSTITSTSLTVSCFLREERRGPDSTARHSMLRYRGKFAYCSVLEGAKVAKTSKLTRNDVVNLLPYTLFTGTVSY